MHRREFLGAAAAVTATVAVPLATEKGPVESTRSAGATPNEAIPINTSVVEVSEPVEWSKLYHVTLYRLHDGLWRMTAAASKRDD